MTDAEFAAGIRAAVHDWMQATLPTQRRLELSNPAELSATLALTAEAFLTSQGHAPGAGRAHVLTAAHCHLQGVFDATSLGDTPADFVPVPDTDSTVAARAAALAVHGQLQLETVSYGSENGGSLFVNLVAMPGAGAFAEKSKGGMRGHTDAVSFPFNGDDDPIDRCIAPSPDFVTLAGLRNPNSVPTFVIPLQDVLALLSTSDVLELKKPQYTLRAQRTFRHGTARILGKEHVVIGAPVLKDTGAGTYVRYSHSNVTAMVTGRQAEVASKNLEVACNRSARPVVVEPGDILVINNRTALHGRGEVGDDVGGHSRWLLRTYALDTSDLQAHKRQQGGAGPHVLYP